MAELHLNGKPYTIARMKLRKWLEFEKSQKYITKAVEDKNVEEYARQLYVLISSVLNVSIEELFQTAWYEIIFAYTIITNENKLKSIPVLRPDRIKPKEMPWDYEDREWFWWVHILAKNYGWSISIIEELDIDDAVSLLQEILVEDQLQKEWQWSLTEIAYPYDSTTKKSNFLPLERPSWMEEEKVFLPATKVRFPKSMLPVGRVIGENGSERIVN